MQTHELKTVIVENNTVQPFILEDQLRQYRLIRIEKNK